MLQRMMMSAGLLPSGHGGCSEAAAPPSGRRLRTAPLPAPVFSRSRNQRSLVHGPSPLPPRRPARYRRFGGLIATGRAGARCASALRPHRCAAGRDDAEGKGRPALLLLRPDPPERRRLQPGSAGGRRRRAARPDPPRRDRHAVQRRRRRGRPGRAAGGGRG
ncbi:MAG: hypothetical protein EON88_34470, partial [Brevundimonas sp.]